MHPRFKDPSGVRADTPGIPLSEVTELVERKLKLFKAIRQRTHPLAMSGTNKGFTEPARGRQVDNNHGAGALSQ